MPLHPQNNVRVGITERSASNVAQFQFEGIGKDSLNSPTSELRVVILYFGRKSTSLKGWVNEKERHQRKAYALRFQLLSPTTSHLEIELIQGFGENEPLLIILKVKREQKTRRNVKERRGKAKKGVSVVTFGYNHRLSGLDSIFFIMNLTRRDNTTRKGRQEKYQYRLFISIDFSSNDHGIFVVNLHLKNQIWSIEGKDR